MKPELLLRQLDAPVTVKNFVHNDPLCNYEFYMVELLNHSTKMRRLHPQEFLWHQSQAHAECDAYSGDYGIDFKLIASQSSMKASSMLSPRYQIDENGFIVGYEGKRDKLNVENEVSGLTEDQMKRDISLVKNELLRVQEFGRLSMNSMEATQIIWQICDCYNLPYDFEESEEIQ